MRRLILFCLALSAGAPLAAGTFEVYAQVDRDRLELGESLQLTLGVRIQGNLDFPPQLDPPSFEGFEARGPQQRQHMAWVNGQVTAEQALVWELTAVKAGTLTLGPYEVHAKTAHHGEIRRRTDPIRVTVVRPKDLRFPGTQPQPQPTLDLGRVPGAPDQPEEDLRDIKPDRPFPWHWAALGALAGLGALFGLLTWWRRRPPAPPPLAVPRDPGQWALEQLERARQGLGPGGEAAFVAQAAALLRDYLRHRLGRGVDCTLGEGLRLASRTVPGLPPDPELGPRLLRLVFGGGPVEPQDADWAYQAVRECVIQAERRWPSGNQKKR